MASPPTFSCKCLNVRIYPSNTPQDAERTPKTQEAGFEWAYIDKDGLQISHEQLVQRTRVPNEVTVLICRLCFTLVTKSKEDIPGTLESHSDPITPARERSDFDVFGQHGRWIRVCVSPEGCVTGRALTSALQRVSPVFDLIVPIREAESPLPTPPPLTPQTVTLSPQLSNLPELFPPPPFVPNHPVFSHLSRTAKKQSGTLRVQAEDDIRAYIEAKRREVLAKESALKSEVNVLWKTWKETQDRKLPQIALSTSIVTQRPPVIRDFDFDGPTAGTISPRLPVAMATSAPVYSALSTSLRQSGMYMQRPLSPPAELSPRDPTFDIETPTASPTRNRDMATPKTVRIGNGFMTGGDGSSPDSAIALSKTLPPRPRPSALKRGALSSARENSFKEHASTKRKAVAFKSQNQIVTVARDINSEHVQRRREEKARGEDAMFDMDEEQMTTLNHTSKAISDPQSPTSSTSLLSSPTVPPKPSALALSLQQNENSPIMSPPRASPPPKKPDLANQELMRMHAGQTPTHRSAWANGYYEPPRADSGSSSSEEEDEDEDDEAEEEIIHEFLPSTSVPIDVPSMRPPPKVADDSLQIAMSRSIDPGPTLDLDPRHGTRRAPVEEDPDDDDDDEANHRAKVAMQPGRGSLHAKRILEREVPDPPASMWRSLA